jgi:hypothetical protein
VSQSRFVAPARQKVADALMLVLRILVFAPAMAAFAAILWALARQGTGLGASPGAGRPGPGLLPAFFVALVPALAVTFWASLRALRWSVELNPSHVRLGRAVGRARDVPYEDVTFVGTGSASERLGAVATAARSVPVRVEYRARGRYAIWLEPDDAERLFEALLERCPRAAGVDRDGRAHAPRADAAGAGARRLARHRLVWGWGTLAGGLLLLLLVALASRPESTLESVRREAIRALAAVEGVLLVGLGLETLRRRRP